MTSAQPIIILENIRSALNVGSILRSAACFDIPEVWAIGTTPYVDLKEHDSRLPHIIRSTSARIKKTSLGAEEHVRMRFFATIQEALGELSPERGVIAMERTLDSIPLHESEEITHVAAFIFGNEVDGVSETAMQSARQVVHVEQSHKKESLNVSTAAAITAHFLYMS